MLIAGVDEAGRGPLAGPVFAAVVILPEQHGLVGLTDSKLLSEQQRERLFDQIQSVAIDFAIAHASAQEIDAINILQASLLAMERAILQLKIQPKEILIDGNKIPPRASTYFAPCRAIVGGDKKIPSISAASILAKVSRDRLLLEYDAQYPQYGFARHKGYPTAVHLAAIEKHGVLEIHRRSFAPVRKAVSCQEPIN